MQNFNLNINPLSLSNPMQQIMELNQKTLKKFSYLEPQELTQIHDPKTLLEKNMAIFIDNSHTSVDYISQLFNILGSSWVNLSNEVEEKSKAIRKQTQSATTSALNTLSKPQPKTAHPHRVSQSSKKGTSHSSPKSAGTQNARKEEATKSTMGASSSTAKKGDNQNKDNF